MDHLEAALLRVDKLEDEAKLLKADLRQALEAIKALTMGESHSKVHTGSSHVPVAASRSHNETTESSPSSSTKAEIKPDAMEFEPCSPAADDVVRNRYGDPLVGQYVSPKKKDADGKPLSLPVYEGPKHGRYYLTASGNKAYSTPTSVHSMKNIPRSVE